MNTQKNTITLTEEKSDVALREEAVLAFWKEHDIFNKSLEKEAPKGDFIFYDGPPFATGLPHYGHILAGTIKDAIPRFWTMNGYRVPRTWGWDCHGLPLENLIEKKLGLATKRDIEEYGVKNFNEQAREAVLEYADDWRKIIPRMGRFVDMENDYKTMDSTYTESVWWVFSELHKKGLVYEGFKSMHLCPRCGTTLSNFEVNQGYKDIKDIAVTVKLPLLDEQGNITDTSLLVWTTTPWTLPGNMAAAVNKDLDYAKVEITEGEYAGLTYIIAKGRLADTLKNSGVVPLSKNLENETVNSWATITYIKGSELVGKSYLPPFNYLQKQEFENKQNAWKIYHADYVELGEEGTGAVHIAPAYGEDDMNLAKEHNIPIVHHVDNTGHFMDFVTDFAGQLVKPKDDDDFQISHLDADIEVLKKLQEDRDGHGVRIFAKENITHSYPHCWRCDTPLLNYATTSWFVEVTKIKDQLVAANNTVHWVPEHIGSNRFGNWLEGARDWAVSRQRYWGAPLPIWRNQQTKEFKVLGSKKELLEHVRRSGNTYMIMRHGEAEFNVTHTLNSDTHVKNGLTELGKQQLYETVKSLPQDIDIIIYSPLQRTKESALIVKEHLHIPDDAFTMDDRIGELGMGSFEGQDISEKDTVFLKPEDEFTVSVQGAETLNSLRKRVGAFLYELEEKYENKKILIITHGDPLWIMESIAEGANIEQTLLRGKNAYPKNAELRTVQFVRLPHNDNYELDYHRPYIDDIELIDSDGTKLERVQDVFDCWFESGSMPYGQNHYPFENLETFDAAKGRGFPAQFIAEGLDQTRGWFYSLMVLGVALFGKSPYENVIVNGLVLAEDGRKMSKSLKNYPDPMHIADTVGVDAMRLYLLSSSIMRAEDLNFSEKGVLELQRKNIGRLHNVLAMYELVADGTKASASSPHILDQWILARLNQIIEEVTSGFKNYELDKATRPLMDLIDDLSVWYLRRSRERLKSDDEQDKTYALSTLREVLQKLALVMAPSMPFYAEYLWSKVKEESDAQSVHLASWPEVGIYNSEVLENMRKVREVVALALEARAKANIKVRQPLSKILIKDANYLEAEYEQIVLDEVNAKSFAYEESIADFVQLDTVITPELKAEGDAREFIRQIQDLRKQSGLQPQDRITLLVQTSDGGEALLSSFDLEIKRITGADAIAFGNAQGAEVTAGEHSFTVELIKL